MFQSLARRGTRYNPSLIVPLSQYDNRDAVRQMLKVAQDLNQKMVVDMTNLNEVTGLFKKDIAADSWVLCIYGHPFPSENPKNPKYLAITGAPTENGIEAKQFPPFTVKGFPEEGISNLLFFVCHGSRIIENDSRWRKMYKNVVAFEAELTYCFDTPIFEKLFSLFFWDLQNALKKRSKLSLSNVVTDVIEKQIYRIDGAKTGEELIFQVWLERMLLSMRIYPKEEAAA